MTKNLFLLIFLGMLIAIIYSPWFVHDQIIGGDWPFYYPETLKSFSFLPPAWSEMQNNGLGGQVITYSIDSYVYVLNSVFVQLLHIPWVIVYKIFFFALFLFFSIVSVWKLLSIFHFPFIGKVIGIIVFVTNTYILLLAAGGQLGVMLAYAVMPWVIASYIQLFSSPQKKILQNSIFTTLILFVQILFDIRFTLITMLGVGVCFLFLLTQQKKIRNCMLLFLLLLAPLLFALVLHAYWLFPLLFQKSSLIPANITNLGSFQFYSFGGFPYAFSLLHPNWPENIFGKVPLFSPLFLLLPIFAYSGYIFIRNVSNKMEKTYLLAIGALGIVGAFLAKGVQDPFGFINIFIFQHVPGFSLYRDPTKFYVLVAAAYSVLIPFSFISLYTFFRQHLQKDIIKNTYLPIFMFLIFWGLWILTIGPAIFDHLSGTFIAHSVPQDYVAFKSFLQEQPTFSRVLWIPNQQRFSFYSGIHPAVDATALYQKNTPDEIIQSLEKKGAENGLSNLSIKYVAIPDDSLGEIFITHREYNNSEYLKTIQEIENIKWLHPVGNFNKIKVFALSDTHPHVYTTTQNTPITYGPHSSTQYKLLIKTYKPTTVILSESYNPAWEAQVDTLPLQESTETKNGLNSFFIPTSGTHTVLLSFSQAKDYFYGKCISCIAFLLVFLVLIYTKRFTFVTKVHK